MRKAMGILLFLLILCVGGISYCITIVYAPHDQVQVTQTVLAGDPSATEGLSIQTHTNYGQHLFWDTTVMPQGSATPETKTDYHFSNFMQQEEYQYTPRGIEIYSDVGSSGSYNLGVMNKAELTGLDIVYQELYDKAVPGQEEKKTVYVADYYTYYPLSGYVDLEGLYQDFGIWNYMDPGYDTSTWDKFQVFFRIPVLSEERVTVSVEKDSSGSYSTGLGTEDGDSFNFYTQGIVTPTTCYFAFNNRTTKGNQIDTSLIPGGYGIYCLDYIAGEEKQQGDATQTIQNGSLELDSLRLAYPMDPEEEFLQLSKWSDEKTLLLYTRMNNTYFLTTISLDTMQQVQRLTIQSTADSSYGYQILESPQFLVTMIDHAITVLVPDGVGQFRIDMQTPNTLRDEYLPWNIDSEAMDYQDGKLALAYQGTSQYGSSRDLTSFETMVYDKNGLQCQTQYRSSLQNHMADSYSTSEMIILRNNHPIEISWQ